MQRRRDSGYPRGDLSAQCSSELVHQPQGSDVGADRRPRSVTVIPIRIMCAFARIQVPGLSVPMDIVLITERVVPYVISILQISQYLRRLRPPPKFNTQGIHAAVARARLFQRGQDQNQQLLRAALPLNQIRTQQAFKHIPLSRKSMRSKLQQRPAIQIPLHPDQRNRKNPGKAMQAKYSRCNSRAALSQTVPGASVMSPHSPAMQRV